MVATAIITVLALATAPLIAPLLARHLGRLAPAVQRKAYAVLAAFPALVLAGLATNLRVADWTVNMLLVVAAYLATGVLLMSCFRLRPRPLGITLGVIGCIPLVIGALAGTLGFLGVGWLVTGQQPLHLQAMPDGRVCQVRIIGSAVNSASSRGYAVSIRRPLPFLSWIEHVQFTQRIPYDDALMRSLIRHPELICAASPEPAKAGSPSLSS